VCWEYILPVPAELPPEVQEAALTRGMPIFILLWGNDLPKFFQLIRQSAIDEQIKTTLDRHVAATAAKLEAMAEEAGDESSGQAANFGDALARELMGGIARQPHLVGPLRGVLQGPAESAGSGNTVLMKRAHYAIPTIRGGLTEGETARVLERCHDIARPLLQTPTLTFGPISLC
jgi:hypothetical protein